MSQTDNFNAGYHAVQSTSINCEQTTISTQYQEMGYVFPVDILSKDEATALLRDYEEAESELAGDSEKLALLKSYPDRLLPSFDRLIRHPRILAGVQQILGADLMVWSAGTFDKSPNSSSVVSWHQDLTYWGLDDAEEVTAWVALSPATVESGCMYFVPGSHKVKQVAHIDTFDTNNLLSRGQEIAVEVDDKDSVAVSLQAGQASLHHGHLFHSSGPNGTAIRRFGTAIRYIKTSMKQNTGAKSLVAHVSGNDSYQHFTVAEPTQLRLQEQDFERCRQDSAIKRNILYEGVEDSKGQRY